MIDEQFLGIDHVPNRNDRELRTVGFSCCRIDGGGAGGTFAPANHIRADHKIPLGIKRLPGADNRIPPAGFCIVLVESGNMGIPRKCMADEDCVAPVAIKFPVRLVGKGKTRKGLPAFQCKRGGMTIILRCYES